MEHFRNAGAFRVVLLCLLLGGAVIVHKDFLLTGLADYLIVQDSLAPADAIIVLAGGDQRVLQAVALYNSGWAPYMIMSGGQAQAVPSMAVLMKDEAVRAGVPEQAILLEHESLHTYQHPVYLKPLLAARGIGSAIIVSCPYHMRRARILFAYVFARSQVRLLFYPVQESWFKPSDWWKNQYARTVVAGEYVKLCLNVWGPTVTGFVMRLFGREKTRYVQ